MKKRLQTLALSLLLAAAASPAFGLGLGQIQVKSRMNEPLVADIPVITNDPAELAQLQAKLAEPDTFVRIGLPLPDKLVSDLRFQVIDGADGKPYIRVTSSTPVTQPLVNFLVEVDWGDGKLVREYSALVATPNSVAATAPPVVEAPSVATAPANTIERPAATTAAPAATIPAAPVATEKNRQPDATPSSASAPAAVAVAPANGASSPAPAPTSTSSMPAASDAKYGPVQRGQTLGGIIGGLQDGGQDHDAVMQALVALNPDAFINGDPNRLRAGAVLRMPQGVQPAAGADSTGKTIARNVARAEIAKSRSTRSTPRRPVDVANAPANAAHASTGDDTAAPAKRVADAHLRIAPAITGDGGAAGTKTGRGSSGGNGDMLQQLQQSQETIATRDAEITELKSRVGNLEQIQQKQAQLIAMKNSELASAQQKLAARQATQSATTGGFGLWWLLPAALAAALLAALWRLFGSRRGRATTQGFASAAQAPAAPPSEPQAGKPTADTAAAPPPAREDGLPTWARGDAWLPDNGSEQPAQPSPAAPATAATDSRLQLARTYIDLGDTATARALLQDVQQEGDAAARAEALALLDSLR
ncbi:FimV/HubP family polar landmark protein [Solilutibacter silvestris]|uniref:FimV/HubP family polar landmark protein n=1 Tax=Solilutibacter silvestris TaxID=1645665 RepID=UPI003D3502FB